MQLVEGCAPGRRAATTLTVSQADTARATGSGDVDAGELACADAEVRISGQGNATLRVRDRLDVRVSGVGQVRYHGDPTVTQRISGAGSVTQVSAG